MSLKKLMSVIVLSVSLYAGAMQNTGTPISKQDSQRQTSNPQPEQKSPYDKRLTELEKRLTEFEEGLKKSGLSNAARQPKR